MGRLWCAFALLSGTVLAFPAEPVDVKAIVQRSVAAENADWKAQTDYSFIQTERDDDGPAKTYEVSMILGSRYRRLIAVNGRPLSPGEQAAEKKKMQDDIQKRKNETPEVRAKRLAKAYKDREQEHTMLLQMAEAFNFRVIGEQTMSGHPAWVLDATPKPGYQPPTQKAKVLTGMRGKLWIAQDGYHWVKVQAEVVQPVYFEGFLARVGPGTHFELEKAPIAGGTWLPTHFSMKVEARILGLFSHNSAEDDTFRDYRREGTSQGAKVAAR